ncbi:expressed unknown protein [Seminavis robusta]|uniref:L domain-like protein n=1 Tax=Seminavis robusta TaxID=568900 RepID=A0A9N8EDQ6_9STRA|nr:expressed unknown protein [Seminavis robusta]|eukprot:Sro974_g226692.1  (739) ;mRNA; r:14444-16758
MKEETLNDSHLGDPTDTITTRSITKEVDDRKPAAKFESDSPYADEIHGGLSKESQEKGDDGATYATVPKPTQDLSDDKINEATKMEILDNAADANTNTNDDVLFVTEYQDNGPGYTADHPILLRRNQMRPPSQPGAFMGAPGEDLQRTSYLNYALFGASPGANSGPGDSLRVGSATNQGLVQANAVDDDTANLMYANPVDLEEAAQHRALQRKQQQNNFLAAALWLFLVVAIIVGFVVGAQKNKEPKVVVLESTEAPTVYGSMTPSEVPSSAPTRALDFLLDSLPDYTLASVNNGSETPQWRAWWWLSEHQNITFLPEWRKTQLFALATFFYSYEGENWNPLIKERWMDDTVEECEWFSNGFGFFFRGAYYERQTDGGLFTRPCNSQGHFTSLHLGGLELMDHFASIPPEILLLTSLSLVNLYNNGIAGPISLQLPTELYELTDLRSLWMSRNQCTGKIPSEIALFTSLSYLNFGQSQLSGQIPSEIALLTSLSDLSFGENDLTGQFSSELGLLTSLTNLDLHANKLSGKFFSELGLLTSLQKLSLFANRLSGPLASELGLLTSLYSLELKSNQFTGPVPSELGKATTLFWLELNNNLLTGQVASELGILKAMQVLLFNENGLTGTIPSELGLLTSLIYLHLADNQFTGPVLSEFGALTALTTLQLNGNQFTGAVPRYLWLLTSLQKLDLSANELSGTIPTEIGMMTQLTSLGLNNNNLTGTLPSQLNASMGLRLHGN